MNHNSISDIRSLLADEGIALKKRFGQNFLIDAAVRSRIVGVIAEELAAAGPAAAGLAAPDAIAAPEPAAAPDTPATPAALDAAAPDAAAPEPAAAPDTPAAPTAPDTAAPELSAAPNAPAGEIWEVGPGIGSLTEELLKLPAPLRLFEIDHGLIRVLRVQFRDEVPIETGDFLETGPDAQRRFGTPRLLCGNLPYSVASSIVTRIIEAPIPVGRMVFLVQTELAQRFTASAGRKEYSALSVLVQNHYDTEIRFAVGGGAFFPRPEVGSVVIVMRRRDSVPPENLSRTASLIARAAFGQRRKAIRNSLRRYQSAIDACGIDGGTRPEQLTPDDFLRLAAAVEAGG